MVAAVVRADLPHARTYLSCLPRRIMEGWVASLRERADVDVNRKALEKK